MDINVETKLFKRLNYFYTLPFHGISFKFLYNHFLKPSLKKNIFLDNIYLTLLLFLAISILIHCYSCIVTQSLNYIKTKTFRSIRWKTGEETWCLLTDLYLNWQKNKNTKNKIKGFVGGHTITDKCVLTTIFLYINFNLTWGRMKCFHKIMPNHLLCICNLFLSGMGWESCWLKFWSTQNAAIFQTLELKNGSFKAICMLFRLFKNMLF